MKKINIHPLYEKLNPTWKKLIDAYEGSGGFADGSYLFKHIREADDKFATRKQMAKYFNFAEIIVNTFRDSVLREKCTRTIDDDILRKITGDCDRQGRSWEDFIKDQLTLALVFGFVDTLIEMPIVQHGASKSRHDVVSEGLRPYLIPVHPLNLINWETDRFGPTRIIIKEINWDIPFISEEDDRPECITRYRYYDRQSWALLDEEGKSIQSGEHTLGIVPLVRLYCQRSLVNRFLGLPLLPDPDIFIDYYNLDSEKREIFRQQTFSLLLISLGENNTSDDLKNIILTGTDNALALPHGARAEFISPDPEQARLIIEEQKQIIRTIFRLKHMKYDTDTDYAKSGEAYRWDYKDMHQILAGLAINLEEYENQLVRLIGKWLGDDSIEERFSISYPRDFNIYSLSETLTTAQKLFSLNLGRELETTYAKRILIPKLMSLTEEEKDTIYSNLQKNRREQASELYK